MLAWATTLAVLLADLAASLPPCPAGRTCIAIDLWIAEPSPSRMKWVLDQLHAANERLAVIDAGVEVTEVHLLPAGELDVRTPQDRNRLARHGAQSPLRWFVVDRLVDNEDSGKLRRGVTWRKGSDFYVIEASSAWAPVLAHELGHVLGLPHSTEAASLMNKSVRAWPPFWKWGFTEREQPRMRSTLTRLVAEERLKTKR